MWCALYFDADAEFSYECIFSLTYTLTHLVREYISAYVFRWFPNLPWQQGMFELSELFFSKPNLRLDLSGCNFACYEVYEILSPAPSLSPAGLPPTNACYISLYGCQSPSLPLLPHSAYADNNLGRPSWTRQQLQWKQLPSSPLTWHAPCSMRAFLCICLSCHSMKFRG